MTSSRSNKVLHDTQHHLWFYRSVTSHWQIKSIFLMCKIWFYSSILWWDLYLGQITFKMCSVSLLWRNYLRKWNDLFSMVSLTIHTGKNLCFTEVIQKFIEIHGWLLLTFFMCLHNQLSSFNSTIVQMSEKRHSSNRQ